MGICVRSDLANMGMLAHLVLALLPAMPSILIAK